MSQIVIESLTKKFGEVVAVDEVDLKLGEGEFLTLLGPSGCGKTTTLRCVAGLEHPEGGRFTSAMPSSRRPERGYCFHLRDATWAWCSNRMPSGLTRPYLIMLPSGLPFGRSQKKKFASALWKFSNRSAWRSM